MVNFDFPGSIEDYVHRIGRTGRAGATGSSYSFITGSQGKLAKQLVAIMKEAKQEIPQDVQNLAFTARGGGGGPRYGRGYGYGGGRRGGGGFRNGGGGRGGGGHRRW